jgi:uncharacterized protein YjbI with pentapeptide repeats
MSEVYFTDEEFDRLDSLEQGEYENCVFTNCDLAGADLSDSVFVDCEFRGSNLAGAKLMNTAIRNVKFTDSKLSGLRFDDCNSFLFETAFQNCNLDYSVFYGRAMKGAKFKDCSMRETDLTEANLAGAALENCDLSRAVFSGTNLEKADLRSAYNLSLDPDANLIRKARFSFASLAGLLDKYEIEIS